jgi:hypothetical protein
VASPPPLVQALGVERADFMLVPKDNALNHSIVDNANVAPREQQEQTQVSSATRARLRTS